MVTQITPMALVARKIFFNVFYGFLFVIYYGFWGLLFIVFSWLFPLAQRFSRDPDRSRIPTFFRGFFQSLAHPGAMNSLIWMTSHFLTKILLLCLARMAQNGRGVPGLT